MMPKETPNKGRICFCGFAIALIVAGALVCLRPFVLVPEGQRFLSRAANSLVREQYNDAERWAKLALQHLPDSSLGLLIAGEAASKLHRSEDALDYFQRVRKGSDTEYVLAQCWAAERCIKLGRAAEAERFLRQALEINPYHAESNERLAVLLQIQGRTFEALPYALAVMRSGKCGRDRLLMVGTTERNMVHDPHFVETCLEAVPWNPVVRLGAARMAIINGHADVAEKLLRQIVKCDAEQAEAQARLGAILLEKADQAEFLQWQAGLPACADHHPVVWYVRGLWAKRHGQYQAAARCFLEAVERDPNFSSANYQLSQVLVSIGQSALAEPFAERSRRLSQVEYFLSELKAMNDLEMMRKVVELTEQLGRFWEAAGWCEFALAVESDLAWAKTAQRRLDPVVGREGPLTVASSYPGLGLNPSDYPLPVWPDASMAETRATLRGPSSGNVNFVDLAAQSGIDFDYYNGTTATSGLEHMLQSTGGGVAVIDYDLDGWPDLFFVQSGPWEERDAPSQYVSRLFRNLGNGQFEDTTNRAGLDDRMFCQGVAVGDYNSDGFPDLYLTAVGPNRLYENNGDGTFRDVTAQAGVAGDEWSVSCAIVDLNGDGMPEIYSVSYLVLQEVLDRMCKKAGRPMGCAPSMFTAEQDRLFQNLGDGRFRDVTNECGIRVPDGKGLGVVAADFEGTGRIHLFVSNDTTANFYFVNETATPGGSLLFRENAILTGLAFDENGVAQSCMGIAQGDVNGDGLLDLFVTNFYNDSNTLYVQLPGHLFEDKTRVAALREPSFYMLGFGTQMLDAELNGRMDIFITNGHVDRTFATGAPDLMPPQYFRNEADGKFTELSAQTLGEYFQREYLGRAVAVLDWNRDGRPDLCISHLDAPAALLTNQTPETGHYLTLTLHGVASNRDAIGASVTLASRGQSWTQQLTAGHGYLASNQRHLCFGLGSVERIDSLTVRWPSGREQRFQEIAVDQEIVLVEGMDQIFPMRVP